MKKTILLSLIASTMIMAGGDIAPVEPVVVEEESVGTFSGQLRAFYIDRTYNGILENNRNSLAFGGWIGYDTSAWNGLSAGIKYYAVEGPSIHGQPMTSANYDPSLYGDNFANYGFIGEAYLNYDFSNTNIKVGRQKLNTPMAGADDARMLPNLFEAAVLSNKSLENTTLIAAHVTRETTGTFSNVYSVSTPSNAALALQSGYGFGFKKGSSGDFANMGSIALGNIDVNGDGSHDNSTSGVTALAAVYTGVEGLKLQAWDYIAWDIMNIVYLQADYGWSVSDTVKLKASAQYINESDIGDSLAGSVSGNYGAAKLGASYDALSGYLAYSATGDSRSKTMNGGIITPWGGMPAFTQGMVTRHMFFADTNTWKAAATYKFGMGIKASAYYAEFDVGSLNTYKPGQSWTATEGGFDVQYDVASVKGLNLRLRANYPRDFAPGLDWNEYRVIANYNF